MLKKELKPCPFCGSEKEDLEIVTVVTQGDRPTHYKVSIECAGCGNVVSVVGKEYNEDHYLKVLTTKWNTRFVEDVLRKLADQEGENATLRGYIEKLSGLTFDQFLLAEGYVDPEENPC